MFIKVCQGYHEHYDKKVSDYYMIFIFFQRLKRLIGIKRTREQHGGDDYFLVSQRAAWGW